MPDQTTDPSPEDGRSWLKRTLSKIMRRQDRGDVIAAYVGEGASNVAVGKNIFQVMIEGRNLALPIVLIALATLAIVAFLIYPAVEPIVFPSQMTGTFNIAVAEFGQIDAQGRVGKSELGQSLSQAVFDNLQEAYQQFPDVLNGEIGTVQIWHDSQGREVKNVKLGVVEGNSQNTREQEAEKLASRISADMVVYGYLTAKEDPEGVVLEFFYASPRIQDEPDSATGRFRLGKSIPLPIAAAEDRTLVKRLVEGPLADRSQILFWLTLAMSYDAIDDLEMALDVLQEAEKQLHASDEDDGTDVLHYWIGRVALWLRKYETAQDALDEALEKNPDLANAYITRAGVHYDRAQLYFQSLQTIPDELAKCLSDEEEARGAQSLAEAKAEIDEAKRQLEQADDAITRLEDTDEARLPSTEKTGTAPVSQWDRIQLIARLLRGLVYRLEASVLIEEGDFAAADQALRNALTEFEEIQTAFEEKGDYKFLAWAQLGAATAYHNRSYFSAVEAVNAQNAGNDALRAEKNAEAAALLDRAIAEYQACIDQGDKVPADLLFRRAILECGCDYYIKVAQDAKEASKNTP